MNSAFCALAGSEVNSKYIHLRAKGEKQNGSPFRFGLHEANFINFIDKQGGCSKKYKMVTKFGLTVFNDNFFNLSKLKISSQQKATIDCLHELSSSAKV